MEDVCEAHGVLRCRMVDRARADAPEKAGGTAVARVGLIVKQQRACSIDAACELACERPLPAKHHRRTETDGFRIAINTVFCRIADRTTQRPAIPDGDIVNITILAINMGQSQNLWDSNSLDE